MSNFKLVPVLIPQASAQGKGDPGPERSEKVPEDRANVLQEEPGPQADHM